MLALSSLGALGASTGAQAPSPVREVLQRAIAAAGGIDNIRKLKSVTLRYAGHRNMINQSRRAMPPWDREPASGSMAVDRVGQRMFAENYTSYPGIGRFGGAWAIKGTRGVHFEPDRNHHGSEIMANLEGAETDGPWAFIPRWTPPLMLLEAWDGAARTKALGESTRAGRRVHAIAFTQRDGGTVELLFDAASGVYIGFESRRDDGVYGDVTDRVEYAAFRPVAGVISPQSASTGSTRKSRESLIWTTPSTRPFRKANSNFRRGTANPPPRRKASASCPSATASSSTPPWAAS